MLEEGAPLDAENTPEEVAPVEGPSTTRLLMFLSAWSSYKKGNIVFDLITPEVGTAPFHIIGEDQLNLGLPVSEDKSH